jgi:hypothetical protein
MIEVSRMAAQGDVLFRRIDEIPAETVERPAQGPIVVGHSETGHHHVIDDPAVALFEKTARDPLLCYLWVHGDFADVSHQRPYDTHETLRLTRGAWEVRRQREWATDAVTADAAMDAAWVAVAD